jgi:hypothetical protein
MRQEVSLWELSKESGPLLKKVVSDGSSKL